MTGLLSFVQGTKTAAPSTHMLACRLYIRQRLQFLFVPCCCCGCWLLVVGYCLVFGVVLFYLLVAGCCCCCCCCCCCRCASRVTLVVLLCRRTGEGNEKEISRCVERHNSVSKERRYDGVFGLATAAARPVVAA